MSNDKLKELFALAPLDATHLEPVGRSFSYLKKDESGNWFWLRAKGHGWLPVAEPLQPEVEEGDIIEIPACERELNRLADNLDETIWKEEFQFGQYHIEQPILSQGDDRLRFTREEWQERRAIRHPESNTPEKPDSSIFSIGDKLVRKEGLLVSGSGRYEYAIVHSIEPFVLKSEAGDMTWRMFEPFDMELYEEQAQYSSWDEVPEDLKVLCDVIDAWPNIDPVWVALSSSGKRAVWTFDSSMDRNPKTEYTRAQWQCAKDLQPKDEPEWIEWNGGDCPVTEGQEIEVKHRDGSVYKGVIPFKFAQNWSHRGANDSLGAISDIVYYRVFSKSEPQPEAAEWEARRKTSGPFWFKYHIWHVQEGWTVARCIDGQMRHSCEPELMWHEDWEFRPITKPQQAREATKRWIDANVWNGEGRTFLLSSDDLQELFDDYNYWLESQGVTLSPLTEGKDGE